jgi:hypothetical protein
VNDTRIQQIGAGREECGCSGGERSMHALVIQGDETRANFRFKVENKQGTWGDASLEKNRARLGFL